MLHSFEVSLQDTDRGVYETLSLKLARHPSETAEYLVTRLLAFCLEHEEGIAFSKGGLSSPDEPAVLARDPTGRLVLWVEVGLPAADRLHKAAKAAPRVAVYPHRDPGPLLAELERERVHRADEIRIVTFGGDLVRGLAEALDRRTVVDLAVTGGEVYATVGDRTFSGPIVSRSAGA